MSTQLRRGTTLPMLMRVFITLLSMVLIASIAPNASAVPHPLAKRGVGVVYAVRLPSAKIPRGITPWTPPADQAIFTVPKQTGSVAKQEAALRAMVKAVKATPKGATIRVTTFNISGGRRVLNQFFGELVRAHQRGVNVQFIFWTAKYKGSAKTQINKLKKELGTNINKNSFVKLCNKSCYSSKGTHHAKLITIDRIINTKGQTVKWVSFIPSGNLTAGSVGGSWNHTQLITKRYKVYAGLSSYFDGMKYDRTKRGFAPVHDGPYTLYFYPQPKAKAVDYAHQALKQMNCRTVKGIVRIAMYSWTFHRKVRVIANRLAALKHQGCDIGVIVSAGSVDKRIVSILKKGHIPVYNARRNGRYTHTKLTIIRGMVGGKWANSVWSGSLNFSYSTLLWGTEIQLRMDGARWVNQALAAYNAMQRYSRRV